MLMIWNKKELHSQHFQQLLLVIQATSMASPREGYFPPQASFTAACRLQTFTASGTEKVYGAVSKSELAETDEERANNKLFP